MRDPFCFSRNLSYKQVIYVFSYQCSQYFLHHRLTRHLSKKSEDDPFLGVFLYQCSFSFLHSLGYAYFFTFTQSQGQSVDDGRKLFNQNPCIPSWPGVFQLGGMLHEVNRVVYLGTFFEFLKFFFHTIYPFTNFAVFFPFPYFTPKLFCIFCIRLMICLHQIVSRIFIRFFWKVICFVSVAWSCPGIFCVFPLSPVSFNLFLLVLLTDLSTVAVFFLLICIFSFRWVTTRFIFLGSFTCNSFFIYIYSFRVTHISVICGLSLKSDWLQVSSGYQNSFQYFGRF